MHSIQALCPHLVLPAHSPTHSTPTASCFLVTPFLTPATGFLSAGHATNASALLKNFWRTCALIPPFLAWMESSCLPILPPHLLQLLLATYTCPLLAALGLSQAPSLFEVHLDSAWLAIIPTANHICLERLPYLCTLFLLRHRTTHPTLSMARDWARHQHSVTPDGRTVGQRMRKRSRRGQGPSIREAPSQKGSFNWMELPL